MTLIYIVRHGETELNHRGVLLGHLDSPLTKKGYDDAIFIAKKLSKTNPDSIYSSDLGRAFITAHIIADSLGITDKLVRTKDLREIDFGNLSGKSKREVSFEYNKIKNDSIKKAPHGESYSDLKKRVLNKLFSLSKSKSDKILIVTHAGCIRCVISEALNLDLNSVLKIKISHRFIAKFEVIKNKIINFKVINE